jgi:MFS family permease
MGVRLGLGTLSDRFGARRLIAAGVLAQAVGALASLIAGSTLHFDLAAATFGFVHAEEMPLHAVVIRENVTMKSLGTIMGGIWMAGGLGSPRARFGAAGSSTRPVVTGCPTSPSSG